MSESQQNLENDEELVETPPNDEEIEDELNPEDLVNPKDEKEQVKLPTTSTISKDEPNDTPKIVPRDDSKPVVREFLSEESVIDVVGEDVEVVMPPITSSGEVLRDELERTPTKRKASTSATDYNDEELDVQFPVEKVFSSFPCHIIPESLARLTRTPVEGEQLEVRKFPNGRLRIKVVDYLKKYSPYSTQTHRACIVCGRQMTAGEMHLNFPADLDRRRIWANLLGFKYKDILRSKVGPPSFSVASGPICTEHFADECFRNHNFNKAAIEAFGVPVAISPDVKTTPSKKRVPWVCTICDFNSCSVVELQQHLMGHMEELQRNKSPDHIPPAGFMCPFCRKCTYGYKTISGFRRHLISSPVQHCHLRRIYEFAKMNCRASELDPIDSWDNWTRRNVYVAYHGCEPPIDEIILTPSPTKSISSNSEEKLKKQSRDAARRHNAVRALSFVGKEGGTSVNDLNMLQRAAILQIRKIEEREKPENDEANADELGTVPPVVETTVESRSNKRKGISVSVTSSPVKALRKNDYTSCPPSPSPPKKMKKKETKIRLKEPKVEVKDEGEGVEEEAEADEKVEVPKAIDQKAFAKMIEKRTKAVQRLISAKLTNQPKKPRKAFISAAVLKQNVTGTSNSQTNEEDADKTTSDETNTKAEVRQPKSLLARTFEAGFSSSMAKYQEPFPDVDDDELLKKFAPKEKNTVRRMPGGGGTVRPNVLSRRPGILSSPRNKPQTFLQKAESEIPVEIIVTVSSTGEQQPEITTEEAPEKNDEVQKKAPKTLAEALEMKTNDEEAISEPSMLAMEEAMNLKKTRIRNDMRISKNCVRQLEAAQARARLFGERGEAPPRFDLVHTPDGPKLVRSTDPEWKARNEQHNF